MHTPQETRKWFLEVGGQRRGPLSVRDIEALLREGAITPSTPVISNDQGARVMSVEDLLARNRLGAASPSPSSSAPRLRPSPTGSSSGVAPDTFQDLGSDDEDPVTDLFNTYQAARGRSASAKTLTPAVPPPAPAAEEPSVVRWRWLAFVALGGLVLAGTVHFILNLKKTLSGSETPAAVAVAPPPPAAPVQAPPSTPVPTPRLAATPPPVAPIFDRSVVNRQTMQATPPPRDERREEEEERRERERERELREDPREPLPDPENRDREPRENGFRRDAEPPDNGGLNPADLRD